MWFRENEPETLDKFDTVLCSKDCVKYKLTGVICTDETDGSIPFMAMASLHYDDGQMELLGFQGFKDKLPPVKLSHKVISQVTSAGAAATGLVEDTPVVSRGASPFIPFFYYFITFIIIDSILKSNLSNLVDYLELS